MTFEERLVVVTLGIFGAMCLVASVSLPFFIRRIDVISPARRAATLLGWRLWPTAIAAAAMLLAAASFVQFEQRETLENTGVMLRALAGVTVLLWTAALVRLLSLTRSTRRLQRQWMRSARPIDLPEANVPAFAIDSAFPVVAVAGIFRPKLIVAQSVLDTCTREELSAIVAHENGHVTARDNLRRLAMTVAPDFIGVLPLGARLRQAWHDAAEEAADDTTGVVDEQRRLALAEALVRVARLGSRTASPEILPASALYRGENLDRRVRRLLAPAEVEAIAPAMWWRRLMPVILAGVAGVLTLEVVHVVVELAVRFLP